MRDRYRVVRNWPYWSIQVGDGTALHGKFLRWRTAARVAGWMLTAYRDGQYGLQDALKEARQALLEVQHAQEVGANWYTRGESGLYQQVAMWIRRGVAAINKAVPSESEPDVQP